MLNPFSPSACTLRDPLDQPSSSIPCIHESSSAVRNEVSSFNADSTSSTAAIGFPSMSVIPAASTTWISASQFAKSERNAFPLPLPSDAPGTKPATSTKNVGTRRTCPTQVPVLGSQILPCLGSSFDTGSILPSASKRSRKSLHGQG